MVDMVVKAVMVGVTGEEAKVEGWAAGGKEGVAMVED